MLPLIHIVGHDPRVRAAASHALAGRGFATEVYADAAAFLKAGWPEGECVLLDLDLPGGSALEVQRELKRRGLSLAVVAASTGNLRTAVEAMKLGAVEFLEKPFEERELIAAMERAVSQAAAAENRRADGAAAAVRLQRLSRRERQVLQGLLGGLSNKAMARVLGLSPRTIEMHRANMMSELELTNLPEALRLAIDAGLAPLGEADTPVEPASARPRRTRGGAGRPPEEELRLVLEASSDGAWDWDLRTGRIRLSSNLVDRLGYVPEAIPDRLERYEKLLHPRDRAGFRHNLEAHLGGESDAYACTYRIRTSDGDWRWTDVRGRVVERDRASGAPLRMVGTANDITERREDEERARETAALLELAQSAVGVGVWNLNLETGELYLCARSRELHGLPPEGDLDQQQWEAMVDPEDLPRAREALERVIADGGAYRAEFRVRLSGGEPRWILGLGRLVTGKGGDRRIVGLNHDITAAKELNRQEAPLARAG